MTTTPTRSRRTIVKQAAVASSLPLLTRTPALAQSDSVATPVVIDWERLSTSVAAIVADREIPGAIASVDAGEFGKWEQGFGVSDLENGTAITSADHFRVGSITKSMTATAILQLVGEGSLGLDDTVQDLVPVLKHGDRITIRHLLSMSSGLFNYTSDQALLVEAITDQPRAWTPDELIEPCNVRDLEFEPGSDVRYSNTNYIVLGKVIETLTGETLADVLASRIFEPLGLQHTSLPTTPELPEPYSRGYVDAKVLRGVITTEEPTIDFTGLHPSVAWAAGGVISTVGDLQVWMNELLTGTLIGEELQAERMTFREGSEAAGGTVYGLGVGQYGMVVGHDGSMLGYQAFAGRAPSGKTVIVMVNLEPRADQAKLANEIAVECFRAITET
jgi:D-alanyl-D-alanine carboxypeptidase